MFEIVFHPFYNELHELVDPKPVFETYETPLRTRVIWEYFKSKGYIPSDFNKKGIIENPDMDIRVIKPFPLSKSDILRVHSPYLVELVEHLSSVGYGEIGNLVQATSDSMEIECELCHIKLESVVPGMYNCPKCSHVLWVYEDYD